MDYPWWNCSTVAAVAKGWNVRRQLIVEQQSQFFSGGIRKPQCDGCIFASCLSRDAPCWRSWAPSLCLRSTFARTPLPETAFGTSLAGETEKSHTGHCSGTIHESSLTDWHKPKSVIRPTLFILFRFFRSLYAILAFLSASCPHPRLAVARYVFAGDAANLLETNTNLA